MDVKRNDTVAHFVQSVWVLPKWEDKLEVQAQHDKPVRVRSITLIYRWHWDEKQHDMTWATEVVVRGARVKKDGTPYGDPEDLNVTYYARTQLAALLSKLVAENMPPMLPQVEYSSDVSKLVSE